MHIIENKNKHAGKTYCYASECKWNKVTKKYDKPRISIGRVEGEPPSFVPNKRTLELFKMEADKPAELSVGEKLIISAIITKYGDEVREKSKDAIIKQSVDMSKTARAVFLGPAMVFGDISQRYQLQQMLIRAFGEDNALTILSLAWYIAAEGSALSNSDVWLERFENPAGHSVSSQEITRLLDSMDMDGMLTFYKEWVAGFEKKGEKTLYDLTSISCYGRNIDMAGWGYNRDKEDLQQVNYALLCLRNTAMPLFAWPLDGSISDVKTLQNTLQFLEKLDYNPDCLMLDRGFSSMENITFMLKKRHTFLQAVRVNAGWIREIIDAGRETRLRPDSMRKAGDRTYYVSTTKCQWVTMMKTNKKGVSEEVTFVYICSNAKGEKYSAKENEQILSQHACTVHVLFCQDLVGSQWDSFMGKLNAEYERLSADEDSEPASEFKCYFVLEKKKWARKRTVDFNMEKILQHRNLYAGHTCFITNDKTIATAEQSLEEYSTRDYIEKDFDEMKNDLDMRRIRVHTDGRMRARLFIQFISEIFIREIRVRLSLSEECKKMTRKQIISHIKGIYKIKFTGKYRDVHPELSKSQRAILEALEIRDSR